MIGMGFLIDPHLDLAPLQPDRNSRFEVEVEII